MIRVRRVLDGRVLQAPLHGFSSARDNGDDLVIRSLQEKCVEDNVHSLCAQQDMNWLRRA